MQNEELKITKQAVLEAASKCDSAKETLKILFPEVFEEDKYIDLTKYGCLPMSDLRDANGQCPFIHISIRGCGEYENRSFYLNDYFNWEIKKDSFGVLCLIPTKK